MSFEWLVALRYLRSPNRPAVLRIVTLLAIVGVAAGVTTLVIALSMNTGFRQAIRDRLLSVTAHVNLKPIGPNGIRDYRGLMARLSDTPGVRSIEPAIYATVLLSSGGHARGIVLKGVDPELERRASEALHHLAAGTGDFAPDVDGIPAVLVGRILANDLEISAGDYVTLTSPQGNLTPFGMLPRSRRFRVTGIFDSGFYDYDANWGFVTLPAAQALSGIGDVVSLLEVRVNHMDDASAIAAELLKRAGNGFTTSTWMDENRALFRALSLEKLVTAI
ncbi:MAG: ABC transporter permease, partial [Candidatus Acidiferrales bacterium]